MNKLLYKRALWQHAAALLIYATLVVWLTRPLVANLGTALAGSSTDALLHYWNSWWVRQAITSNQPLYFTKHLFYPEGASLLTHNIGWLNALLWLPVQLIFDGLVTYNIIFLLNLVLGGFFTFLLANELTKSPISSFLGGVIYMAWPYRLSQLDHANLISTQWIPLLFLFVIMAIRQGKWRYGVVMGILIGLIGYNRWQLLIPAGIMLATFLLVTYREWLYDRQRRLILLLGFGVGALLLAPPALALLEQQLSSSVAASSLLRESEESVMQSDLLAFITPDPGHPLWGEWAQAAYNNYYPDRSELRRFPVYLGLVNLILAGVGIWRRPKEGLPWLLTAAILFLLALGPILRFNGNLFPEIPTLYRLLEPLFVLRLLRLPERFVITLALPFAMLAAYGIDSLLTWFRKDTSKPSWLVLGLAAGLGLLILFDTAGGSKQLQQAHSESIFEQLAAEDGEFAILSLPIDEIQSKRQMFDQTVHGRPLLHGHISRPPTAVYQFIDDNPWLRVLRQIDEMPPWLVGVSEQLAILNNEGIRYIIMYKEQVSPQRLAHWQRYLSLIPIFEDDRIAVYRTNPVAGTDFLVQKELSPGVGPVAELVSGDCFQPNAPFEVDVLWGTRDSLEGQYQVRLVLLSKDGEERQSEIFPLDADGGEVSWPANTLIWGYYPIRLIEGLRPGSYTLTVALVQDAGGDLEERSLVLGDLTISGIPCSLNLAVEESEANVSFDDKMRLLGYRVERPSSDQLDVRLHWRGEKRMEHDYKVFIHIFDLETGIPVAQDDSMPLRGGLPTRFWALGEEITDNISIDLSSTPPGRYGLAIGVYDSVTGERLSVLMADGQRPNDGRLVTEDVIIVDEY